MSPARSKAQERLFQIAEHNPGILRGKNKRLASLPKQTLHDFAAGSEKGKPERMKNAKKQAPSGPGNRYDRMRQGAR